MKSCQLIELLCSGVGDRRKSTGDAPGSAGKCAEVESNLQIKTQNEKYHLQLQPGEDSPSHIFHWQHHVKINPLDSKILLGGVAIKGCSSVTPTL